MRSLLSGKSSITNWILFLALSGSFFLLKRFAYRSNLAGEVDFCSFVAEQFKVKNNNKINISVGFLERCIRVSGLGKVVLIIKYIAKSPMFKALNPCVEIDLDGACFLPFEVFVL